MLIGLPALGVSDSAASAASAPVAAGLRELIERVGSAWSGPAAPKVRLLPGEYPYSALAVTDRPQGKGHQLSIGIAESDLQPVRLDFGADPHLLLFGDSESGKTNLLRVLTRRITTSYRPDEARIILVDHRRALFGDVTGDHLIGYGTDRSSTSLYMREAARSMQERMPPADITPEQLRRRSWWTGPELFVLIDDYDMVVNISDNPFLPLLDYLQHGRDIGLHVIVSRRMNGAGRALYEPFVSRIRDVGSPGIMLSGDKLEGALLGGFKPEAMPPGRGRLIRNRGGNDLVQLAWLPPATDDQD
jgi:S-DNA-T family DNA segregation ATPase FtsK/SpoIIIE